MRVSIGDYDIIREWGGGGRRFVARPPERIGLPGPVLVQELAVDAEGWPSLCDRLSRLSDHPDAPVLATIEVGPDLETGGVFLVTELAEPSGPPQTGLGLVVAAARALHALHEAGEAYGPFTAEAVVRTAEGRTVLDLPALDAGIGQLVGRATWAWIEAADPDVLGGEPPARASDLWSLGVLLHRALSPRRLYPGIDGDEAVTAVQKVLFTRPGIDPALSGPLRPVVERCLEPDPADRPASAAEVAEAVEASAKEGGR